MSRSPTEAVDTQQAAPYIEALNQLAQRIEHGQSHSGRERNCCFLNTRGERFADISAVSGFDFQDDGRAIASGDWDHDGDVDLWIANRTGPQLRFLRNDNGAANDNLVLRLEGTSANRDAIGARVEVYFRSTRPKLIQTHYAGHGFLSQSSKWLHFGLGQGDRIDRVEVHWPGGQRETFKNLQSNHRYLLKQGTAKAELVAADAQRKIKLISSTLTAPQPTQRSRVWLAARPPVPELPYLDGEGNAASVAQRDKAVLLNLWASWCAPCVKELRELSESKDRLNDKGLTILALNVDALDDAAGKHGEVTTASAAARLGIDGGTATQQLAEKLEILYWKTFGRRIALPVPCSFLIDRQGRLAAVYLGAMQVDGLLSDIDHINDQDDSLRTWSDPLAGRWRTPVNPFNLAALADAYLAAGYSEDAADVLQLAVAGGSVDANTLNSLGAALLEAGQGEEAEIQLRRALHANPNLARARYNLALLLTQRNEVNEAQTHLRQAIDAAPSFSKARMLFARTLEQTQQWAMAETQYRAVLEGDSDNIEARNSLAMMLARQNRLDEAETEFRALLNVKPLAAANYNLGRLLLDRGQTDEAIRHIHKAFNNAEALAQALNDLGLEMVAMGKTPTAVLLYQEGLRQAEDHADLHFNLATALYQLGQHAQAIDHCRQAHQHAPNHARIANALAWMLATSASEELRNPQQALRIAQQANDVAEKETAELLDTLAAAQAAAGNYEAAVATAQRAIVLADQGGQKALAGRISARMRLYENKSPFIEPAAE